MCSFNWTRVQTPRFTWNYAYLLYDHAQHSMLHRQLYYFCTFLFRSRASSEFIQMCPWTCIWFSFALFWSMCLGRVQLKYVLFLVLHMNVLRRVHCIHSTRMRSSNKISRGNVLEPQPLQSFTIQTAFTSTYRRFKGIFVDFRGALKRNLFDNGCCLFGGYDTLSFIAST